MPQAKTRNTTKPVVTPTAALIAAHKRALAAERAADEERRLSKRPNRPSVTVPEIGANCTIYEPHELTRLAEEHIAKSGIAGLERIAFRKVVEGYGECLTTLIALQDEWRKTSGVNALEERWDAADSAVGASWKALLARAKSDPRSIPEIAAYCSKIETVLEIWRVRDLLKVVAGGKAVRK